MRLLIAFVLPVCVGLGISQIFIVLGMYKAYRFRYLLDYLNFLIFLNIHGFINIIGPTFASYVMRDMVNSSPDYRAFRQVLSFMAIPFLFLAWYFFILMTRNLVDKKLPRIVIVIFLCFMATTILIYGIMVLGDPAGIDEFPSPIVQALQRMLRFVGIPCIAFAIGQLFFHSGDLAQQSIKKMVRSLGGIYIALYVPFYIMQPALRGTHTWPLVYPLFHFSMHLWPIIFLRKSLKHLFVVESIKPENETVLAALFADNNISAREAEIIRKVLNGKSYKEIEKELFISIKTVRNHMSSIFRKLKVENRFQMINFFRNTHLAEETNRDKR